MVAVRSSDGGVAAASGGSFSGSRQLARGRSRLQASTSNACLAEEDLEDEDSFCHLVLERGPSVLRHSSTCSGPSVDPLLVVTVGPDGASVPLTEQHTLAVVQTRPSSGSSSGASAGIGGSIGSNTSSSSRGSSLDKGAHSNSSAPDSPAGLTHTRPPPKAAESLQEQQERQRLQELRQQKQELVVARATAAPALTVPAKLHSRRTAVTAARLAAAGPAAAGMQLHFRANHQTGNNMLVVQLAASAVMDPGAAQEQQQLLSTQHFHSPTASQKHGRRYRRALRRPQAACALPQRPLLASCRCRCCQGCCQQVPHSHHVRPRLLQPQLPAWQRQQHTAISRCDTALVVFVQTVSVFLQTVARYPVSCQ